MIVARLLTVEAVAVVAGFRIIIIIMTVVVVDVAVGSFGLTWACDDGTVQVQKDSAVPQHVVV